jgi:hypothetical protein
MVEEITEKISLLVDALSKIEFLYELEGSALHVRRHNGTYHVISGS